MRKKFASIISSMQSLCLVMIYSYLFASITFVSKTEWSTGGRDGGFGCGGRICNFSLCRRRLPVVTKVGYNFKGFASEKLSKTFSTLWDAKCIHVKDVL